MHVPPFNKTLLLIPLCIVFLFWVVPYRSRTTGDCIPARSQDEDHYPAVLEGKGGGYPSPTRGVTWPSEGDDVMNEGGWQHKVRLHTLSLREELTGFMYRQGDGPWECRQG